MFEIDGVKLDITKPETLNGITIKEGGFIEQKLPDNEPKLLTEAQWKSNSNFQPKK